MIRMFRENQLQNRKPIEIKRMTWNQGILGYEVTLTDERELAVQFDLEKNESSPEYNSVSLCVFAIDDGCSEQDALTDEELTEFGRLLLGNDEIQSMINELKISNQISEIEVQEEHMGMRP